MGIRTVAPLPQVPQWGTGVWSYVRTGDYRSARWARKVGSLSTTYHAIEVGGVAMCRKTIEVGPGGIATALVERSTYGTVCQSCRAKLARIATGYAATPAPTIPAQRDAPQVPQVDRCPVTGHVNCADRYCELHYMSAPLRFAPWESTNGKHKRSAPRTHRRNR